MPDVARAGLPFTKMQAVGNDFVVVDEREWPKETDWPQTAIRLCDRHFGVGADGLLVAGPSKEAYVRMRFFNPDGTPDMCGNGLRCVAAYAFPLGSQNPDDSDDKNVFLESPVGIHRATSNDGETWTIGMGHPKLTPADIPILRDGEKAIEYSLTVDGQTFVASSASTGSTHTVLFVPELPEDEDFFRLGPLIEKHTLFPQRTSVLWAAPDPDFDPGAAYNVRIWERGVGETLSCGTGALAVAVLSHVTGRTTQDKMDEGILVDSEGGILFAAWGLNRGDGEMVLGGKATTVYQGVWRGES